MATRHGVLFLCLVLLAVCTGCVGLRSPQVFLTGTGGALHLGAAGPVLEEGDIILSRRNNVLSGMFARGGAVAGPYGHAAMFCRTRDGQPVVMHIVENGLQCPAPNAYLAGAVHVAVVRYRGVNSRAKLGAVAREWIARDAVKPLKFDLTFREANENANQFSCMGLVYQIYGQSGLPEPFRLDRPAEMDRWFAWVLEELDWNMTNMPTASSVLANPEFAVVGEWWHPERRKLAVVDDAFVETLRGFVLAGYVPGQAPMGARGLLWSAHACGFLSDVQRRRGLARALLSEYGGQVHAITERYLARPEGESGTDKQLQEHTRRVTESLRDVYFVPAPKRD